MPQSQIDVLVSGSGSNLRALHAQRGDRYAIRRVLADRPCAALEWAQQQGLEVQLVDWRSYGGDRSAFSHAVAAALAAPRVPELVACAGFMRLLSPNFFASVSCPVLNIHPSLLPAFKGAHAQRQALQAGVRVSGATVHFMTAEMDAGGIVLQQAAPVYPDDTESSLQARILELEHQLYPQAVALVLQGVVQMQDGGARVQWRTDWRSWTER